MDPTTDPDGCSRYAAPTNVRVVSFTRNFGQMSAILAGFKQATRLSSSSCRPCRTRRLVPQMVAECDAVQSWRVIANTGKTRVAPPDIAAVL
jgi:hypothetical protein